MALFKCPECGREISEYAKSCPSCGFPVSNCYYEIVVTEMNPTEELDYAMIALLCGMNEAEDAENKLKSLPCIIAVKDDISDVNDMLVDFCDMGLTCKLSVRKQKYPYVPETEYIWPDGLNKLAKIIMVIGIIVGLAAWIGGSWNGKGFEWDIHAFLKCLSYVFSSFGVGIILNFMAEVINLLSHRP